MSIANIFKKLNSRDTRILPSINTITKIIFITLIAITATFFVKKNFAVNNIIDQTQKAQNKSNNAESWQLNSWNTTTVNALTSLTGEIPFTPEGNIDISEYQVSGLLGTSTKMVASLYQPQASGIQYIAQIKDNFLGKSTYAQGVAFSKENSLQPLLPIWKSLRNIVYALSSIIFIIIGIMIMLRVKISPQTVITIQNSIPKLITSLILVTFSYAIAGLLIDLSYWIQSLAVNIIVNNIKDQNPTAFLSLSLLDTLNPLSNASFLQLSSLTSVLVPPLSMILLGGIIGQVVIGTFVGGLATPALGPISIGSNLVANSVGGAAGGIVGAVGGVIVMIVIFILIAIWMIKLFFGLLTTYVSILVQIITAPFVIGIGAFPNSKMNFSSWLIGLISKIAVFPVVLIAVIFVYYLISISSGNLWTPNLLYAGIWSAFGSGGVIGAAIGISGLAMISKLPALVPEAIFMLKPSAFGKAIGEGFASTKTITKPIQKYAVESGVDQAKKVSTDQNGQRITTGWRGVVGRIGKTADKLNK